MGLHIASGAWYTNNLSGRDTRARAHEGAFELSFDLNHNLAGRTKGNDTDDAQELIGGEIDCVTLVQLSDRNALKGLARLLDRMPKPLPEMWTLSLYLEGPGPIPPGGTGGAREG